ncbi:hypothetical protein [Paraflavitalea sp. CAU 1676]|uniref:hypothetical protein n=1 Tax=Paraflavitalea sp. CAU 1676 TaxID=3032598 RepID=UPI0023DB4796|nr:hypothetical protein [Paraflavitalea sp. CAU 1676]MDF2191501.1 hypothetical protein [Paraflavitalea sp. CAU 1676]
MGILSLFKKLKTGRPQRDPAAILRLTLQYVPEYYRESQHYKDSVEFLQHREWELALDSLIELADESGHYFSETFWLDLSACADTMKLTQQGVYCREQVLRNERDLGWETPKGWTTIKIDEAQVEHKIAQIADDGWIKEHHLKDKVHKLMKRDGFYLKAHGRGGIIYYVEKGRLLEIGYELSMESTYTKLLYFDVVKSWTFPDGAPLTADERAIVRVKLEVWLKLKRIRVEW